jgi:D-alanyl-D-alanine carboxypeptidase/D-alanyl-D-alanine-endopeptidase (penicillin-binding protein 4)
MCAAMRARALSIWLVLVLALAALPAAALGAGTDLPGHTPPARPGTEAASKGALSAAELQDELTAALRSAGGASGAWVADVDPSSAEVLFSDGATARRIPASNQKLFTTAAFLDEFGATERLETRAFARGKLSGPRDSVLGGDLVIVGDGDPAFGTARFARANDQPVTRVSELAGEIAAAGVKKVKGRVLADDTIFDRERRAGPYLSPLSGLSFNNGYDGGDYAHAPELVAAEALKKALRKRGVRVAGRVGRANLTSSELDEDPLASVESPTIARLIEETNVPSNNFFAEMLLKRVGAASGKRGTRERGASKVEAFADALGSEVQAVDGSGLSRKNKVAPAEIGDLLTEMATDADSAAAFRGSLPVAGREGTLADRMRGTAAEGNCAAKTGTLSNASGLSGYCQAGGHLIAFSILNNEVDVGAARVAQDRMAAAIARYQP